MINRLKKSKAGFTLIELMICVSIIGILSAIAIPSFLSYRAKGADATAKSEARNYMTTALAQVADTGATTTFLSTNLPLGFTKNPDITMSGTDLAITSDGVITPGQTFLHLKGTNTYYIQIDGSITTVPVI